LSTQSLQLVLRGLFREAKAAERESIAYAAEFTHPQTTGLSLAYKLLRGELQGDYSEREETVNALVRHSTEHKIVFWSLWADIFTGFARARDGEALAGIEMMDKPLKVFADMKLTYFRPFHLGMKARAYNIAGDLENARAAVSEGIAFANESGERVVLSDLIRLSGELHLAQSGPPAAGMAESLFAEAIALAQVQASKLHEIRAATSLARLWQGQGKHADARDLLHPVYSWFSDDFESPDLMEAKAVLDGASADFQHAVA
jgi:predicted ATPase